MTVIILPMMLSTMVSCAVWRCMFHYQIGILNILLKTMHLKPVLWLQTPHMALISIIIVDTWQWTPFCFLLIQAAVSSVDKTLYEAASIDGAGYIQTVFHITLPVIRPQFMLVVMLRVIDTFKLYDKVYALTKGGPGNATETLSYFIYRQGFSYFNVGLASTASVITVCIVFFFSFIYIKTILGAKQ